MSDDYDKAFSTHHVEKLTDTNYRSWSIKVRAIFRAKQILSIVNRIEVKPTISETDTEEAQLLAKHETKLHNFN